MITESCLQCRAIFELLCAINNCIDLVSSLERYKCLLVQATYDDVDETSRSVFLEAYENNLDATLFSLRQQLEAAADSLKSC